MSYLFLQGDAEHLPFPDRSVDLVFGSPPYIDARTYGINAQRACQEWIDWMLVVTTEACRVSRGLVLWVCASGVRNHCYQPAPEGLLYEWWKRGGQCWRPAYWYRSGIPGSGGQHWLRADIEYVLSFVGPDRRPQRKTSNVTRKELGERRKKAVKDGIGSKMLSRDGSYWVDTDDKYLWNYVPPERVNPGNLIETEPEEEGVWTDNTAMGRPPKPENRTVPHKMTDRRDNGLLVKRHASDPAPLVNPGNLIETDEDEGVWTDNTAMGHVVKSTSNGSNTRRADGLFEKRKPPADEYIGNPGNLIETEPDDEGVWTDNTAMGHVITEKQFNCGTHRSSDGSRDHVGTQVKPVLANPGNLIETEQDDVWTDNTAMGHPLKCPDVRRVHKQFKADGTKQDQYWNEPELSNPGNLIKTSSGYGSMGSPHAHDNEAPFPEALAEFFIKTACKPGGTVLDPFSGSGTTVVVADRLGRHGIGLDIRSSQVELAERRITRPHSERKRTGRMEKDMPLFS